MHQVEGAGKLSGIHYTRNGRAIGNLYWMPAELRELADSGRLYVADSEHGLAFVSDGGIRKQFAFQTSVGDASAFHCQLDPGATYVSELIFNTHQSGAVDSERTILLRLGFAHETNAILMRASRDELMPDDRQASSNTVLRQAGLPDSQAVKTLLSSGLDALTDALPTEDALLKSFQSGWIWLLEGAGDRSPVGCVFCELAGKRVWIRHVVIAPEHRGKGLGKLMLQKAFQSADADCNYALWVKLGNVPARNMYQKLGFSDGSRQMEIWVYNKQEETNHG